MTMLQNRRAAYLLALAFASLLAAGCHASGAASTSSDDTNAVMPAQQKAAIKQHKEKQGE